MTTMAKKKAAAKATGAATATKLAVAAAAAGVQAKNQASDLGERIAPVIDDARERLAPVVDEARERLAPVVDEARERLVDLTGTVATRIDDITGTVATRLDEALPDRYTPAVVTARVPSKNRPKRWLQALFVLGLGVVAAVVARRLTGGGGSAPVWRSASDQPTPVSVPATGTTPTTGAPSTSADATVVTAPVETSVDVAGGTPEEVAADATDTPHAATTPDDPAHKVVLD
jgi:hypothetical protein